MDKTAYWQDVDDFVHNFFIDKKVKIVQESSKESLVFFELPDLVNCRVDLRFTVLNLLPVDIVTEKLRMVHFLKVILISQRGDQVYTDG